jgi:hypothetical protein
MPDLGASFHSLAGAQRCEHCRHALHSSDHCPLRALELQARIDRISDTRRWAFYTIGAQRCATDTGAVHGPRFEYVNPQGVRYLASHGADVRILQRAREL